MRKKLKYLIIVLAAVFALSQLIRPDISNPPVNESERVQAFVAMTENVSAILARSCNDCHTNETRYPWYSRVTPVSWWLQDHVEHGRSHLNLSEWGRYSPQQKSKKLEEICEVIESKEMPLPSYLWAHGDAAFSPEDGRILCDWAQNARQTREEQNK